MPAHWDEDALELRLVDVKQVDEDELDSRVLDYLGEHDWSSTKAVEKGVTGRAETIRESLKRLERTGRATSAASQALGRTGSGIYWNLAQEAELTLVPLPWTTPDDPSQGCVTNKGGRPVVPSPIGGRPPAGATSADYRDHQPMPGDEDYRGYLNRVFEAGHITSAERHQLRLHHIAVRRAAPGA